MYALWLHPAVASHNSSLLILCSPGTTHPPKQRVSHICITAQARVQTSKSGGWLKWTKARKATIELHGHALTCSTNKTQTTSKYILVPPTHVELSSRSNMLDVRSDRHHLYLRLTYESKALAQSNAKKLMEVFFLAHVCSSEALFMARRIAHKATQLNSVKKVGVGWEGDFKPFV